MYGVIKTRQCYFLWATIFIWWLFLLCSAFANVLVLFQNMIKQNEELFDTLPCFKSELYLSSRDSLMACVPLF